ncbi:hypothetical protein KVR01_009606 [Diaporthe batatas]|uniref:uncharacterized protein n=1 Tax=Diaporthe batatas TaxID=748121 RepID=UPI001D0414DD|nr:uncharacterized protein KVR01_009606 [Diaporthe batatas]KAG8161342.1 hypothetical protein KVR01_009606 [Diaporthe batatas]
MAHHTNFASYNMTLDDIDQSEIEQMMQQIAWEQSMNQAAIADTDYDTASFDPTLSPLSGYASPSSMTTGSTNPSPLVPLLDYDMTYPLVPSPDDPESLFPELMNYNTTMDSAWVGPQPEGFTSPFLDDDQAKLPSAYPLVDSQLYAVTAAPDQATYASSRVMTATYLPTISPATTTAQPQAPIPSSPPQPPTTQTTPATTETTSLACPYCGATFAEKAKLNVHTNKHTKPFRCAAPGCTYGAAEKKSLHRHMQGRSDYDVEHRAAARRARVPLVKHRCPREGCTYATFRDDNLKRHGKTCTGR